MSPQKFDGGLDESLTVGGGGDHDGKPGEL